MSVRYVRRTEARQGEVTVRLIDDAGVWLGEVTDAAGNPVEQEAPIGCHQALAAAVELAGDGGTVGIIDESELWKEEWGDLEG